MTAPNDGMTKREIPRLYRLEPSQIREMMRDLHYVLHEPVGYRVVIAIDTHELFDYCFPINPTDKRSRISDPEELAESQVALSHLFNPGEPERPPIVLLPEYQKERRRIMDAIRRQANDVFQAAEVIQAMVAAGNLEDAAKDKRKQLDSVVQESFRFLLTVLLGIHSIGVRRMKEVHDSVLKTLEDVAEPEDRAAFHQIINEYKRSSRYDTIFKILEEENRSADPKERELLRNKNNCDAIEIDRLIYLNTTAERAYVASWLKNPYVFLYVSSAPKSERLFKRPEIKALLPRLWDRPYSFLRNRHQILAYSIYRSRSSGEPLKRAKESFNELKSLYLLLSRVKKLEVLLKSPSNDCRECVFDGHQPQTCPLANQCLEVMATARNIRQKREEVINWGLFNDITSYSYLLDAQVPQLGLGYEIYMQLFQEILEKTELRNIALERMHNRLLWINRASDWTLARHASGEEYVVGSGDMKSEKDEIRGIDQYLPTNPRFTNAAYKEIMDLLLCYFKDPRRPELVEKAYDKFHALDPKKVKGDEEYDLLSCYFYLSFGFEGESVHAYIKDKLLPKRRANTGTDTWRESLYILCWSARRFGLFEEAEGYAREGMVMFPDEARFPHGRAITIYAWCEQQKDCPYSLSDSIGDSEKGLALYLAGPHSPDQVAASYNNIAYLLACEVRRNADSMDRRELLLKLEKARRNLESLKTVIKKSGWQPQHPEFFHTEAFLEFQEVTQLWRGADKPRELLATRLLSAKRDLKKAIDIYDCSKYQELRREIEEFYDKEVAPGKA